MTASAYDSGLEERRHQQHQEQETQQGTETVVRPDERAVAARMGRGRLARVTRASAISQLCPACAMRPAAASLPASSDWRAAMRRRLAASLSRREDQARRARGANPRAVPSGRVRARSGRLARAPSAHKAGRPVRPCRGRECPRPLSRITRPAWLPAGIFSATRPSERWRGYFRAQRGFVIPHRQAGTRTSRPLTLKSGVRLEMDGQEQVAIEVRRRSASALALEADFGAFGQSRRNRDVQGAAHAHDADAIAMRTRHAGADVFIAALFLLRARPRCRRIRGRRRRR